jgi:hypothetical protein
MLQQVGTNAGLSLGGRVVQRRCKTLANIAVQSKAEISPIDHYPYLG